MAPKYLHRDYFKAKVYTFCVSWTLRGMDRGLEFRGRLTTEYIYILVSFFFCVRIKY